jgi:7,8-dihydropterin-6-yl-methyl-4-(beta-D-ribofuranosyl)aminobenzene 5'-phosphate synthase
MTPELAAVERVEILTLQDNYIDLTSGDGSAVVQRAIPLKGDQVSVSLLAEHGFSALVRVHAAGKVRSLLFDFGFSQHGAAFNADALGIDLRQVEALALSHGHMDHTGGLEALSQRIARPGITLTLHPEAYRTPRYMKLGESFKAYFPPLTRERIDAAGITVQESSQPRLLLDETILFLGQIPRRTDFEKGAPNLCCEKDGVEMPDSFEDDTALVMHLKDKGLVVLSGCAHAGIINTVHHAREVTGVAQVHAVMGGFHLSGPGKQDLIRRTVAAMADIAPDYVIPTHCTGREAVRAFEQALPQAFILNMSGTRMVFV